MKSIFTCPIFFLLLQFAVGQYVDAYKHPVQTERSRDFNAIHYKLTIDVDLNKKMIEGENQITLAPLNDNFDRVVIDVGYLIVSSVLNFDGRELKFEQKHNQVFISLIKSYNHSDN